MGRIRTIWKGRRKTMYGYLPIKERSGAVYLRKNVAEYFKKQATLIGLPRMTLIDIALSELIRAGWSMAFKSEYQEGNGNAEKK